MGSGGRAEHCALEISGMQVQHPAHSPFRTSRLESKPHTTQDATPHVLRSHRSPLVGLRRRYAGDDPRHHRLGHHLPAPPPGPPGPRAAPAAGAVLPFLAVAQHRHALPANGRRSTASTTPSARPPKTPTARRCMASTRCCGPGCSPPSCTSFS